MLLAQRCPHTGIINFFSERDPHLSIGSIARPAKSSEFHWRCYVPETRAAGIACDLQAAVRQIESLMGECAAAPLAMAALTRH